VRRPDLAPGRPRLGLRANLAQFTLLVGVNALVGGMVGQERTVLPLLAGQVFGVRATSAALAFILAFGAVKAVTNLAAGALSDRLGRKGLIVGGMWLQAAALALIAATRGFGPWLAGAVLLGAGTAMVYPTLLAAVGDVAHPRWRASAVGVYRLWRDAGFAVGALLAGVIADLLGLAAAIWVVAVLTGLSGLVVAVRMYETHHPATQP
jgi:MFS family permease